MISYVACFTHMRGSSYPTPSFPIFHYLAAWGLDIRRLSPVRIRRGHPPGLSRQFFSQHSLPHTDCTRRARIFSVYSRTCTRLTHSPLAFRCLLICRVLCIIVPISHFLSASLRGVVLSLFQSCRNNTPIRYWRSCYLLRIVSSLLSLERD